MTEVNIKQPQHSIAVMSEQETRAIITPFAFKIDESLFGIKLAGPWARALALTIDLLFIAMLSETAGEILALLVAIAIYRLGAKKQKNAAPQSSSSRQKGRKRRALLRLLAAFIVFVTLFDWLPDLFLQGSEMLNEQQYQTPQAIQPDIEQEADATSAQPIEYSLIKLVNALIEDLGLGFGWAAFYFTVFTSVWHGQTPGKKLMHIKVLQLDGTDLSLSDSFGRYGGYGAGIATGLLGFIQIFWDPNRQAIHDKISATVVVKWPIERDENYGCK
jgi:uncharacterized RDD family membrane protein YckC